MHDDALAAEAGRGGKAAMELLVLRYYDEIHAYAVRRTGSAQAAQDIAQTVFEKLVRALPRYRPCGRFRPFLFTIACNAVRDHFRRQPCEIALPADIRAPIDLVEALMKKDEYRRVRRYVLSLPDSQREALILYYYHGMSVKETARITGTNVNTVKSRLRLAVAKLRSVWEAENDEEIFP